MSSSTGGTARAQGGPAVGTLKSPCGPESPCGPAEAGASPVVAGAAAQGVTDSTITIGYGDDAG